MPFTLEQLAASPNALAAHYHRFRVGERLLLTGHSHQAWPDRALAGHQSAFDDAAELADLKWERAFERADRVREGFRRLLDDPQGLYALGSSTHELVVRFLSALPLADRPRLVTTDGEYHSMRRQLGRLAEEGIEVERVPALPAETVGERLAAATTERTAAVLTSTVFYRNAHIAGELAPAARACRRLGAALLLDVYHQLNAVPFSLRRAGLGDAFVVGGGY
jgi:kynureninase